VESSVIIFEFFLLSILARVAFTRTDDLNLIRKHNNLPIEESDEGIRFEIILNQAAASSWLSKRPLAPYCIE